MAHTRSVTASGAPVSYSSTVHTVHSVHSRSLLAPGAVDSYVLSEQAGVNGVHSRSLLAPGATVSYSSSSHTVNGVQPRSLLTPGAVDSYVLPEQAGVNGVQTPPLSQCPESHAQDVANPPALFELVGQAVH